MRDKRKLHILLLAGLQLFILMRIHAVPALPVPHVVVQPDGTEITIQLRGDEFFHYTVSEDNYLLIQDEQGYYCYAEPDANNTFVSTGVKARDISRRPKEEKSFLKTLSTATDLQKKLEQIYTYNAALRSASQTNQTKYPLTGSPKSLVILVEYTDVKFVTPNVHRVFTDMLNKQGYSDYKATGSARDYLRDNSMGAFSPEFVVVGPYTLPQPMAYYGRNYPYADANATQMIVDACKLASADIDFSLFDTDGDEKVDNVFIIYAGYNESEYGPDDSVLPHRWWLDESTHGQKVYIQGKQIFDYACTSELRGSKGDDLCGIGTFLHEFSHVLGLPDYYPTTGGSHHTLSDWSIMDSGFRLNDARTPPAYSAYDRFYLGWLTPEELKGSQNVALQPLLQSNQAYIITQNGNHNLNASDPQPTEFFTLESRQKEGWDAYLPGHGLLVTRICYNKYDWGNNAVNNLPSRLGVKIIEADGIANDKTLSGDPFPGTSNVTHYIPQLRNGTLIENKRIHVEEQNGIIYLQYLEADGLPIPLALDALNVNSEAFTALWKRVNNVDGYRITVYSAADGTSRFSESFDNGFNGIFDWSTTENNVTTNTDLCGNAVPAVLLNQSGDFLQTEQYVASVTELSFHAKTNSQTAVQFILKGWNGTNWKQIEQFTVTAKEEGTRHLSLEESDEYTRFRFELLNDSPLALDDITVSLAKRVEYIVKDMFVYYTDTTFGVASLFPDLDYYYTVRASRFEDNKEEFSPLSNRVQVHTLQARKDNRIRVLSSSNGTLQLYISSEYIGRPLYLSSVSGQLIQHIPNLPYNFVKIDGIPQQQLYVVHVGVSSVKILMP